jgi:hypothetical protein
MLLRIERFFQQTLVLVVAGDFTIFTEPVICLWHQWKKFQDGQQQIFLLVAEFKKQLFLLPPDDFHHARSIVAWS